MIDKEEGVRKPGACGENDLTRFGWRVRTAERAAFEKQLDLDVAQQLPWHAWRPSGGNPSRKLRGSVDGSAQPPLSFPRILMEALELS